MEAKSSPRENYFVPGTSRNREAPITLRVEMAREEIELLEMGARIKELRKSHGYKQQWIADQVGVTLRTYQFWQAGKSPPEQQNLERLAELFHVTPKFILKGETPEPATSSDDRLAALEAELRELNAKLDRILPEPDPDMRPATAEEFLEEMKRATRTVEQLLGRIGRDVGRRDLRSRRAADRKEEAPPTAA